MALHRASVRFIVELLITSACESRSRCPPPRTGTSISTRAHPAPHWNFPASNDRQFMHRTVWHHAADRLIPVGSVGGRQRINDGSVNTSIMKHGIKDLAVVSNTLSPPPPSRQDCSFGFDIPSFCHERETLSRTLKSSPIQWPRRFRYSSCGGADNGWRALGPCPRRQNRKPVLLVNSVSPNSARRSDYVRTRPDVRLASYRGPNFIVQPRSAMITRGASQFRHWSKFFPPTRPNRGWKITSSRPCLLTRSPTWNITPFLTVP
jgi:hypothetical protein